MHKCIPYLYLHTSRYNLSYVKCVSQHVTRRLYLAQVRDKIQSVEKCLGGSAKPHWATIVMCDSP